MKIYIYQDPGLYYGVEYIPVVADCEEEAYNLLVDYLKAIGREKHIFDEYTFTVGCFKGQTKKTPWRVNCSTDIPTTPGVVKDLIHSWME